MTDRRRHTDADLMDLVLEKSPAELEALELDAETRRRLEEMRRLCALIRAVERREIRPLRPERIQATVLAARRGGGRLRLLRPRLGWAAALLLAAAAAFVLVLPRRGDVAQAMLYGGVRVERAGAVYGPEAGQVRIGPGDRIVASEGGFIRCEGGALFAVGKDTELTCLLVDKEAIVLRLERGRLRCERIGRNRRLVLWIGASRIEARDAVFTVQYRCRRGDAVRVDRGRITVACRGKEVLVDPAAGAFSYRHLCPCRELKLPAAMKICCRDQGPSGHRPFFVTADPSEAFRLAREQGLPILVVRRGGRALKGLFGGCCIASFMSRQRRLEGLIWLFLDSAAQAKARRRWDLEGPEDFVLLAPDGAVRDRGRLPPRCSLSDVLPALRRCAH